MQQGNVTASTLYDCLGISRRFKKMSQQDVTSELQSFKFQIFTVTAEGNKRQWVVTIVCVHNLPYVLKFDCHSTKYRTQVAEMLLKRTNDISTPESK